MNVPAVGPSTSVRVRRRATTISRPDPDPWVTDQPVAGSSAEEDQFGPLPDPASIEQHAQRTASISKPKSSCSRQNTQTSPSRTRARNNSISRSLQSQFDAESNAYPALSTLHNATDVSSTHPAPQGRKRGESSPAAPQQFSSFPEDIYGRESITPAPTFPKPPYSNIRTRAASVLVDHDKSQIDLLEVVDPEVFTAANLSRIGNSIVLPNFRALERFQAPPTVDLDPPSPDSSENSLAAKDEEYQFDRQVAHASRKRDTVKRILKGIWAYLKTPMGVLVGIYGFLVVFWGAGLVLILLNWIDLAKNKDLWVEICSQILNGLFTVTGVGLIPTRLIDSYRIIVIHHYMHVTIDNRAKFGMVPLKDRNELLAVEETTMEVSDPLPDRDAPDNGQSDKNRRVRKKFDFSKGFLPGNSDDEEILTRTQVRKLLKAQDAFQRSQSWYRPYETPTHFAFPITYALLICLLNDGNSFFQCILCGCMWGMNRHVRPAWTTGTLIPLSFLCGIFAGVFIMMGGKKTNKSKHVAKAVESVMKQKQSAGPRTLP